MLCVGIDMGSRAIKAVLLDTANGRRVLARGVMDQGIEQTARARRLFERLLKETAADPNRISRVVATGYGRNQVDFAHKTITEITCHARGVRRLLPEARSIIDIGGQDSKVIKLDGSGLVEDFAMNDRCAAGTGRFLEKVAEWLESGIDGLGAIAAKSRDPSAISSMCVVFAETEIIGLLASGAPPPDIVAGVQASIASRVAAMAGRSLADPVIFTGGVARIPGMREALSRSFDRPVLICPDPELSGALGAALLAAEE